MATWLGIAIFAQFLFAVSLLIDRHIVVKAQHIGKPIVYAFYTAVLSGVVIVIGPFGFVSWPDEHMLIHSLIQACAFVAGLYFLYSALSAARASDVAPVVGAVSAVASLILAGLFIDGDISSALVFPVLLLAAGTALISHFHFTRRAVLHTLLAGVFLGTSIFIFKLVVLEASFLDGFFWTRTATLVPALGLLVVPAFRAEIFKGGSRSSQKSKLLVIGNKVVASFASVLTAFAVSLGSVSIVNALSGIQFVFLYVFAFLFGKRMPDLPGGRTHGHGGWQTGVGVMLICIGLAALFL